VPAGRLLLELRFSRASAAARCPPQVLLQPRCCFVVSGEAYSQHQHGIEARAADEIGELCCNREAAGVAVGEVVPRAPRRVSLVFVRKIAREQ